jgi:glyoxylase-like metal-dependent hydrolase (beta-lactamase superfamily II)
MIKRFAILTLSFALLAGCTAKTPEQQFVDDMMRALGGKSRVDAVKSLTLHGEGVNYNLGQDLKPELHDQQFAVSEYTRVIDLADKRERVEQTRTPKFPYYQGQQPQKQIQALDGAVAFNVNGGGQAVRIAGPAEVDRRNEYFHHPLTLLRGATITNVRTAGATRQADIDANGTRFTITIDAAGVPLSISHKAYNPNLGDVVMTTTFAAYQDVDGLKLPTDIADKVDDFTTAELHVTQQTADAPAGDLAAPAGVAATPVAVAAPNVTAEPIGKGIWLLNGQSHHSVLVEFSDHLMLIEAPQSEARTLAVMAKAKQLVNNKPLQQLVTTHHHFDHTAGMRAAISEGMTVITHAGNRDWVEAMAKRSHSLQPDTLSKNATRLEIETVDDQKEIKDQVNSVMLYHVAGNPHSDTMLMAYIPRDRVLIEVDAFSPGAAANPYAANLLENIRKRNLRIDKIVSLHGPSATLADLQKAVAAARGN